MSSKHSYVVAVVLALGLGAVGLSTTACSAPAAPTDGASSSSSSSGGSSGKKGDTADKGDKPSASSSSGNTAPPAPEPGEQDPELKDFVMPDKVNTGFTGGAEVFKVPLWTDLEGTLTWAAADPSIVTVAPIAAPADYKPEDGARKLSFAMITATKAGTTKVTVTGNGKSASADVTVKAYTTASYEVGKTRYKTGGTEDNRKPCAGCHEAAGGADHSPTWLAYYEDSDVLQAIQTAVYASDKYEVNKGNHKWNLTEPEKDGIMAYLRGLPPKAFQ